MPEHLTLREQVEHLLFVDELDRTRPHDVEVLRRLTSGLQDDLVATVELDVGVLDHGR